MELQERFLTLALQAGIGILVLILGLLLGPLVYNKFEHGYFSGIEGKIREAWKKLAKSLGADFAERASDSDGPKLSGTREGREFEMWSCRVPSEFDHRSYDFLAVASIELHQPAWDGVTLRPRDMLEKFEHEVIGDLAALEEVEDIRIGEPEFDRKYLFGGDVSDRLLELVRSEQGRTDIARAEQYVDHLEIDDGRVIVERVRAADGVHKAKRFLESGFDVAGELDAVVASGETSDGEETLFPEVDGNE